MTGATKLTNCHVTGHRVLPESSSECCNHASNDDEGDETSDCAGHQERASTHAVKQEDSGESEDCVDDTVDTGGQKGRCVGVETQARED